MLIDFTRLRGVFNWTWTYRSDSNIVLKNGYFEPHSSTVNLLTLPSSFDIWRAKRRMVFWLANECDTHSNRELYIEELKQYLEIDIYGKCGQQSCPSRASESELLKGSDSENVEECFNQLAQDYLFAIVFENSNCRDYVGEELFKALKLNVVPIAMGSVNYSLVAPHNSVIDAFNFSPKELADYVLDVATDYKKYKEFMSWKRLYSIRFNNRFNVCQLCQLLHKTSSDLPSTYGNIQDWWFSQANCKPWHKLYDSNNTVPVKT